MNEFLKSMTVASSGMAAQSARLRISAENIANSDTPGYRRKVIPFQQVVDQETGAQTVRTGRLFLDQSELERIYDPAHPLADEDGYFDGTNVNMLIEIADSREAQRSYEANLKMFDQSRKMASSILELLRR